MRALSRSGRVALTTVVAALLLAGAAFWPGIVPAPENPKQGLQARADSPAETTQTAAPNTAAPTTSAVASTVSANEVLIPAEYALRYGQRVRLADSWEELVATLSNEDRRLVDELRARYPEAFKFTSRAQLQWMIEHGYPMPAEIVEAQGMPMDELIALGKNGNLKASMLAMDRLIKAAVEGSPAGVTPKINESPLNLDMIALRRRAFQKSCSPFNQYLNARYYEELARTDPSGPDSAIRMTVAALSIAQILGDPRSRDYAERLAGAMTLNGHSAVDLARSTIIMHRTVPPICPIGNFPLH